MSVWLLLLLTGGEIIAVTGPLPYGIEECRERAGTLQQEIAVRGRAAVAAGNLSEPPNWIAQCHENTQRPVLGQKLGQN